MQCTVVGGSLVGLSAAIALYGMEQFAAPDAAQLRTWLASLVDPAQADELAAAVDAEPPRQAAWVHQGT